MSQKLHVKTGDTVVVISGKDKGKQGKIKEAMPKKGRVVIEGVNIVKRHTKPTQANPKGGIIEKEAPINASKVMILDPETKKPTRIKKSTAERRHLRQSGCKERCYLRQSEVSGEGG